MSVLGLTIVRHISVSFLEDEMDSVSSSPYLFHSLTVGHPRRTLSIYLYQLVRHLREQVRCYSPGDLLENTNINGGNVASVQITGGLS